MISTSVCIVRPAKTDVDVLTQGLNVLARATRMVFARVYQHGHDSAKVKREVCSSTGLLVRHYSGCRADAIAAVRGWRERLKEQRVHLCSRLVQLEARRENDYKTPGKRRRNAVATRKAVTRLTRVEAEFRGQASALLRGPKAPPAGEARRVASASRWQRPICRRDRQGVRERSRTLGPADSSPRAEAPTWASSRRAG